MNFVSHPDTLAILEDEFYEKFKNTMDVPIESYYR